MSECIFANTMTKVTKPTARGHKADTASNTDTISYTYTSSAGSSVAHGIPMAVTGALTESSFA